MRQKKTSSIKSLRVLPIYFLPPYGYCLKCLTNISLFLSSLNAKIYAYFKLKSSNNLCFSVAKYATQCRRVHGFDEVLRNTHFMSWRISLALNIVISDVGAAGMMMIGVREPEDQQRTF